MTTRTSKVIAASGDVKLCEAYTSFSDSFETDEDYYDAVESQYLMWGAAHREKEVCKDIFTKAFSRYPCGNPALQALVAELSTATTKARLARIKAELHLYYADPECANFIKAAEWFATWLECDECPDRAISATKALERHTGDKAELEAWIKTELTFEIWARGLED